MPPLGHSIRRRFFLEPGTVFLNHGSFGTTPRAVLAAAARWRGRMEANPDRFLREVRPGALRVDAGGGSVGHDLLRQFQADLLGVPVIRPKVPETKSLGAAYADGQATGMWSLVEDLRENWVEDKRWEPTMDAAKRDEYYKFWKKAVTRTFDWFEAEDA